ITRNVAETSFTNAAKCVMLSQLLLLSAEDGRALLCVPCDASGCAEPKACGGTVLGSCGCCAGCAKQRHESCGGFRGLNGTCDRGLQCVVGTSPDGGSVDVGVCEDAAWDVDLSLGSGPCRGSLVKGCDLVDRKCVCGQKWSCSSPYSFPSWDACHIALQRTEGRPSPSYLMLLRSLLQRVHSRRKSLSDKKYYYYYYYQIINVLIADALFHPSCCCIIYGCFPPVLYHPVFCTLCPVETPPPLVICCLPFSHRCECLRSQLPAGNAARVVSRADGAPGKHCDVFECVSSESCLFPVRCLYTLGDLQDASGAHCLFLTHGRSCLCSDVPEGESYPVRGTESPIYCQFCTCLGQLGESTRKPQPNEANPLEKLNKCHPPPHPIEPSDDILAPPACGALENCNLTERDCAYGFQQDLNGCRTCHCRTRKALCREMMTGCALNCPFGFQTGSQSCPVCRCRLRPRKCQPAACGKRCPHGFQKNRHGCHICRCKTCPEVTCDKGCPDGLRHDARGCPVCQCKAAPLSLAVVGLCLSKDGRRHGDGETWHDGCRDCYCHDGQEMCSLISCPPLVCLSPTLQPGHCCPFCPGEAGHSVKLKPHYITGLCHGNREYFAEGKTWSIDSCTQCTCLRGQVLCETKVCPPLLCQRPIRTQDSCCSQCDLLPAPRPSNSSCRDEVGGVYRVGESWRPDPCSSCACVDGAIKCLAESCPPVSCTDPVLHKGQCCPYCLGDVGRKAVCHYGGAAYTDEQRWHVDECTRCYCLQGQTLCSTVSCPALPCREAARASGRCCPMCSGEGRAIQIFGYGRTAGYGDAFRILNTTVSMTLRWSKTNIVTIPVSLLYFHHSPRWLKIQVIWTDYHEGLQTDPYRPLRHADYNSRYGGAREVPEQNNLQDDGFYQTV
uniref:Cysteine rich transmembrane BMP regulator 1 n=1 Tax=Paramormyrops kingsleyae TaxID=1676925 RepID=A0A3B3QEM4_9TELE